MGGRGDLPLRPLGAARAHLRDRHAAAHRERIAARRACLLLSPTPTRSRASSGCAGGRSSTRWAGTTTACRPSAACRTTSACAATRPCPTTPISSPPAEASEKEPVAVSRPNFVELCLQLTESDERAFEALWRRLGLSVDWSMTYTTIGRLAQRISQRSFLASAGPRRGLSARGADAVGRRLPDRCRPGGARGSRAPRGDAPGALRRRRARSRRPDRDHAPELIAAMRGAARPSRGRAPRRSRRQRGADAAVRHARAGAHAPARRAREGHRSRDGLHLRRPHRRGLVARARPAGPLRARPRRAPAGRALGGARLGVGRRRARAGGLRGAARARRSTRRAGASSSCCSRAGDLLGEPQPVNARREVLREGRAPGRDHHEPPVVHPHDRASRCADRARAASCSGTRPTCARATRTGSTG